MFHAVPPWFKCKPALKANTSLTPLNAGNGPGQLKGCPASWQVSSFRFLSKAICTKQALSAGETEVLLLRFKKHGRAAPFCAVDIY